MSIQGQFRHFTNAFMVLPLLSVQIAECGVKECERSHYMLSVGWVIWAVDIIITL